MAFRRHRASDKVSRARDGAHHRAIEDEPLEENALDASHIKEAKREKVIAASADKTRKRIMARAVNILAARPRSERQLRERLIEKPWAEPALVDECIAQLKELGYVDDDAFARNYTSSRVSAKPVGRSRIARELAGKKLERRAIDEALDEIFEDVSEESLIDRAIEKRIRTHGRPEDRKDAKRLFDYLARLGFGYDLIIRKLQALRTEIEE